MPSEQDPLLDAIPWPSLRVKDTVDPNEIATPHTTLDAQLLQAGRSWQAVTAGACLPSGRFEGRLV